jgi:glycosyltransferase involved in cell wall biosynthesis
MLSALIPVYNKEKAIEPALEAVERALRALGQPYQMVVVDDESTDGTWDAVQKFAATRSKTVVAARHDVNQGKGYALLHAFQKCQGDLVLFIDADLDLPPDQVKLFLYYLERYKADAVIGSKRHPDSIIRYPLMRRFLSRVYQIMNYVLFSLPVSDTQVGLKLFRREVLTAVFHRILVKRYAFDLEILLLAYREGFHIKEAPIVLEYSGGRSAVNYRNIAYMFIDTMAIFYRLKILRYYERQRVPEPELMPTAPKNKRPSRG